jgi:O-antigen ligase
VAAVIFFAVATDTKSQRAVRVSPTEYLTLNGRTNVWSDALGHRRSTWLLGRGVGAVGTASQRAGESLVGGPSSSRTAKRGTVVDSAYLAVATDIGFIGLAIVLALLGRLLVLARAAAVAGAREGWVAFGVLVVMMLDALTRESLTGFPTAYVGMLIVGLALASAAARERDVPPPAAA